VGPNSVDVFGDNSTLDAQGHAITANSLSLGLFGGTNVQLLNRGDLTVVNLAVANQNFNLTATDQVTSFQLSNGSTTFGTDVTVQDLFLFNGATATTSAVGNITGYVQVFGSTLTLGAALDVGPNSVDVFGDNSTLDAQGHAITANSLSLGLVGGTNVQLLNDGAITAGSLNVGSGTQVELHGGNDTAQSLLLSGNSDLTIKSGPTGFTLAGTSISNLSIQDTSTLTLELNGLQPGWVFRWANPDSGDHIATLTDLIDQGRIVFTVVNGGEYTLFSQDGYTYVFQPVPEPALSLLAASLVGLYLRRRKRQTACAVS
jgi:hypothetical protein